MKTKLTLTDNSTKETPTQDLTARVDKACQLLLECMDFNNISKSESISAMASLIVSILATSSNDTAFFTILKMMEQSFKETRKGIL